MSRSEVIQGVLELGRLQEPMPDELEGPFNRLVALAIVGALHEHEMARRVDMVDTIFDRLRSAAEPVGEPAGAETTDREEVDDPQVASPSAPADHSAGGSVPPGVYLVDEERDNGPNDIPTDVTPVLTHPVETFVSSAAQTYVVDAYATYTVTTGVASGWPKPATSPSTDSVPSDEEAKPEAPNTCPWCTRTFDTPHALGGHKAHCSGRNAAVLDAFEQQRQRDEAPAVETFPCDEPGCGKAFPTDHGRFVHIRRMHGARADRHAPVRPAGSVGGTRFVCEHCAAWFLTEAEAERHEEREHAEPVVMAVEVAAPAPGQPERDEIDVVSQGAWWRLYRFDLNQMSTDRWQSAATAYDAFDAGAVQWKAEVAS